MALGSMFSPFVGLLVACLFMSVYVQGLDGLDLKKIPGILLSECVRMTATT